MLTTLEILNILKLRGYTCEISAKTRSHIIVKTDNPDRVAVLKELANMFSIMSGVTASYNTDKPARSSVGYTKVDRTTILVKPIKKAPTHYETTQINKLNAEISNILQQTGYDFITIKYKRNLYNVVRVEKTPGTPKSDFHFIDKDGNQCLWISHKAGTRPTDFQQWSGMSDRVERTIYSHTEVQAFIKDLYALYPKRIMPNRESVMKVITNPKLKKMAVYGSGYTGTPNNEGINNVCYVLQGDVELKAVLGSDNLYTIEAFHKYENGDDITGDYTPVLAAIYKGDRPNFGIAGLRAGIFPVKSRTWITKLK